MQWKFIILYGLSILLTSCTTYGKITEDVSRAVDPKAHQAYERSVACQKQGKTVCGK
jgi:hypothetical protein